jgi:hypothetical protein
MNAGLRIGVYVFDTGPLITLAAADSLDYLLFPNTTVVIPDAVFYEATRDASRIGAQSIVDWVQAHHDKVELAATRAFIAFQAAQGDDPKFRLPNLGEQSAVEVIEEPHRLDHNELGVLLGEETAILRRIQVTQRDKIVAISTMDYLKLLEGQQRIQSAESIFERAMAAGRNPSRKELLPDHPPVIREAVRDTLDLFKRPRTP